MEKQIQKLVDTMTIREKIGQLIQIDFRHWEGKAFTQMNEDVAKMIADYHLGGIILFRENLAESSQIFDLLWAMQEARVNAKGSQIPLFLTVDQEGGIVTRLQDGTNMPGNMALGAIDDASLTEEVAYAMGRELSSLGFNINFAPTVDVNSNPQNPVIGIRSFSSDADKVAKHGLAYMRGMQKAKVGATAKHFPGHGDTAVDSHFGLPHVYRDLQTLQEVDLKPFKALMDEKLDMIMTAHIVVPSLDDAQLTDSKGEKLGTPATLSYPILTQLMREEMGYDGVVITDAMNMEAIANHFNGNESSVMALEAGADIVLMPVFIRCKEDAKKLEELYCAIEEALEDPNSNFDYQRLDESVGRILKLKAERGILAWNSENREKKKSEAMAIVGCEKHRKLEREAAEKAVTVLKDDGVLPIQLNQESRVLVLSADKDRLHLMAMILEEWGHFEYQVYDSKENTVDYDISNYDYVLCETYNLTEEDIFVVNLLETCSTLGVPFVHMASRNPYDIRYLEKADVSIAVYGSLGFDQTQGGQSAIPANIPAGLRVLLGQAQPEGKLPVEIADKEDKNILFPVGYTKSTVV